MERVLFSRLFQSFCMLHLFQFVIIVRNPTVAYNVVSQIGETVNMKCLYNASVWKLDSIVWFHNENNLIKHDSSVQDENVDRYYPILPVEKSSATLQIRNITFGDAGVYSCMIYFSRGKSVKYTTTLQVRGLPVIGMAITNVAENDSVFSTCCTDSALYPYYTTIEWTVDDEPIFSSTSFASKSSLGASSIYSFCSNVTFISNRCHHGQLLKCSLVNGTRSTGIILNIRHSPRVRLEGKGGYRFVKKNEMVELSCIAEGNPKPQVFLEKKISLSMWAKFHAEPVIAECRDDSCTTHTYTVGILSKEDTGTFRCSAKNGVGSEVVSEDVQIDFQIFQNILQILLDNIVLLMTLLILFGVLFIAISIKVICKGLKHKYDLSSAPIRTQNMTEFEIRRLSNENIPDVCRSLRTLPPARDKTSQSKTEDNSGYQELRRDSLSTDGYELPSCVVEHTVCCAVHYHTLERA